MHACINIYLYVIIQSKKKNTKNSFVFTEIIDTEKTTRKTENVFVQKEKLTKL